ncbi:MAG: ferritin-like domain-containing protein [Solirubrobacteraceae bacterium]
MALARRIWAVTGSLACLVALALVLAGCGASRDGHAANKLRELPAAERSGLIDQLNGLLAADQETIFAYTFVGPLLSGRAQRADGRFLGDENTHAGVLRGLIARAGAKPHARRAVYDLGDPHSRAQVLDMLRGLEQTQIALYLSAIPRIASAWVRTVLASILANDAQHMAVLNSLQRTAQLQGAFVGGEPPRPAPSSSAALLTLLRVELIARSADDRALRSERLAPAARRLLAVLTAHERAHAEALARALSGTPGDQGAGNQPGAAARLLPRSWPSSRKGWLDLLQTVQARVERVYYTTLPRLSAPEALLAASIFAADAQQSVLLSELVSSHLDEAVPAALVRGESVRDSPN